MPATTLLGISYSKPDTLMQLVLLFKGYLSVKCMFALVQYVVMRPFQLGKNEE